MIEKLLQRSTGVQRADGIVESKVTTPAFCCREFAWELPVQGAIIATSVATGFGEALLGAIRQASEQLPAPELLSSITMVPGLQNPSNQRMTYLAAIRYPYHQRYASWDRELAARTLIVFPAYRSELGGQESREVYDELVHSRMQVLNWDRPERPQIGLKARNAQSAVEGWKEDQFLMADFSNVEQQLAALTAPEDFLVVRNYAQDEQRITRQGDRLYVRGMSGEVQRVSSLPDLVCHLRSFVFG